MCADMWNRRIRTPEGFQQAAKNFKVNYDKENAAKNLTFLFYWIEKSFALCFDMGKVGFQSINQ